MFACRYDLHTQLKSYVNIFLYSDRIIICSYYMFSKCAMHDVTVIMSADRIVHLDIFNHLAHF